MKYSIRWIYNGDEHSSDFTARTFSEIHEQAVYIYKHLDNCPVFIVINGIELPL